MVSKEGIIVDPGKIKSIMEWETPKNVDDVIHGVRKLLKEVHQEILTYFRSYYIIA